MYTEKGETAKAIAACEAGLAIDGKDAAGHYALGELYVGEKNYGKAAEAFQRTIRYNPQMAMAYFKLANVYQELDRESDAIALVETALSLNPMLPRPHMTLGDIYFTDANYAAALNEYHQALHISPGLAEGHFKAAAVHFQLEQYLEALIELRIALRINAKMPECHHLLGQIYQRLGELEVAKSHYHAALSFNSQLFSAYADLGDIAAMQEDHGEARTQYLAALKLSPKHDCREGDQLWDQGSYDQALAQYRIALGRSAELPQPESVQRETAIPTESASDRRRHTRYLFTHQVHLAESAGQDFAAETLNVSKEGVQILTDKKLDIGSEVQIRTKSEITGELTTVDGIVVNLARDEGQKNYRLGIKLLPEPAGLRAWGDFLELSGFFDI